MDFGDDAPDDIVGLWASRDVLCPSGIGGNLHRKDGRQRRDSACRGVSGESVRPADAGCVDAWASAEGKMVDTGEGVGVRM